MQNPNNTITIVGRLENGLELTHKYRDHAFHEGVMLVKRASGAIDRLPVSVPAKLLTGNELNLGEPIRIEGQLRSYKLVVDGAGRLQMKVFAQRIRNAEKATENDTLNCVQLTGTIIGQTTYRHTPFGRAICDQLIIVDREFGKYDRIPLISWAWWQSMQRHLLPEQRCGSPDDCRAGIMKKCWRTAKSYSAPFVRFPLSHLKRSGKRNIKR